MTPTLTQKLATKVAPYLALLPFATACGEITVNSGPQCSVMYRDNLLSDAKMKSETALAMQDADTLLQKIKEVYAKGTPTTENFTAFTGLKFKQTTPQYEFNNQTAQCAQNQDEGYCIYVDRKTNPKSSMLQDIRWRVNYDASQLDSKFKEGTVFVHEISVQDQQRITREISHSDRSFSGCHLRIVDNNYTPQDGHLVVKGLVSWGANCNTQLCKDQPPKLQDVMTELVIKYK